MALNADVLANMMTQNFKAVYPSDVYSSGSSSAHLIEEELTKYHKVLAAAIVDHINQAGSFGSGGAVAAAQALNAAAVAAAPQLSELDSLSGGNGSITALGEAIAAYCVAIGYAGGTAGAENMP